MTIYLKACLRCKTGDVELTVSGDNWQTDAEMRCIACAATEQDYLRLRVSAPELAERGPHAGG